MFFKDASLATIESRLEKILEQFSNYLKVYCSVRLPEKKTCDKLFFEIAYKLYFENNSENRKGHRSKCI